MHESQLFLSQDASRRSDLGAHSKIQGKFTSDIETLGIIVNFRMRQQADIYGCTLRLEPLNGDLTDRVHRHVVSRGLWKPQAT